MHCCHCGGRIGDDVKIQPTRVPEDGGDVWCPRCFVARRMRDDPSRFNARQAAAVRCQLCGWQTLSFGALPGTRLRCGHCGRFAGLKVSLDDLPLTRQEASAVEELAREAGYKDPRRIKPAHSV